MQLIELQGLLQDYSLHYFVSTSRVLEVDEKRLICDTEKSLTSEVRNYLSNLTDLITHTHEFVSENALSVRSYLSRLIGTAESLKTLVQQCEDTSNVFESELKWVKALAVRGMITILNNIVQELSIVRNQLKNSRLVRKARDKVCMIIWEKIPQIFNILSIMIGIEMGQSSPSEIVDAIGNGLVISEIT